MRILIVSPHFYPENFKCNDMAFELQRRGHDVTVMTAIPDYPKGKFYKGYGLFKKRKETINGVKINRSCIIPRGNGSSFRLVLNYISYLIFACFTALRIAICNKFDTIIVHETSPIFVGIPAIIVKKIQKIPMHFWVLDLWPESLSAAGGINNKIILSVFERLTRRIYKNCDNILIGSKGYKQSIIDKYNNCSSINYFPNWVEDALKKRSNVNVPDLPKGFNIMIGGNMGDAQDLPHVMETALKLKGHNINFIFVGDGRKKSYVEGFARDNGLENIRCLGRFPIEVMSALFDKADVLFLSLKNEPIFAITVPSRLQAYMSSGKPVVAMINGEARELIREADCGWSVPAEDSQALADLLLSLSKEKTEVLNDKGNNGRVYSNRFFDFTTSIDRLERFIRDNQNTISK